MISPALLAATNAPSHLSSVFRPRPAEAAASPSLPPAEAEDGERLRQTFNQFVGETFYGHLLKAMRKTVGKPAYFHGGRGEEVFQGQLDQLLAEKMAATSGESFSGHLFDLYSLSRSA